MIVTNLALSQAVLPRPDTAFLAAPRWSGVELSAVAGVRSVAVALAAGILAPVALKLRRFPDLRASVDAGANASVLPIPSVASLAGFGAVAAALPAFGAVRDGVLGIGSRPLVSLAVATDVLAARTGSASGGTAIALDALGETFMHIAAETGTYPELLHRVAVISSGTLDGLSHYGAVVTMLAVSGCTHRQSSLAIVMVAALGALLALAVVIALGSASGSF
jgi:H+/gluconate symporter-like permease